MPNVEALGEDGTKAVIDNALRTGAILHLYMNKNETSEDVRRWFLRAIEDLWPVALGSVSLRKSPCIRENCSACASGQGHSSYALSGYRGNRRFSVYVPDELAPDIQRALEKGRRLQDLLKEAGVRYLRAEKRERRSKLPK
ncbi:MAG TPA: hypothetical protein VMT53_09280 [Terriglobales bacterium]|nr:hypothetical protein [Terriglobales bacterium]